MILNKPMPEKFRDGTVNHKSSANKKPPTFVGGITHLKQNHITKKQAVYISYAKLGIKNQNINQVNNTINTNTPILPKNSFGSSS